MATLNGTINADVLVGTLDADFISGDAGNDSLLGGDGADTVYGGSEDDVLLGEGGADELDGGDGNDVLLGGDGDDAMLQGGEGNDTIAGGEGNDGLYAGYGNNSLLGGGGDDWLSDSPLADTLRGGAGNDVFSGTAYIYSFGQGAASGGGYLGGDAGDDQIYYSGDDFYAGTNGAVTIDGGADNDVIRMHLVSNSSVTGGDGNDLLEVTSGSNTLFESGNGNDTISHVEPIWWQGISNSTLSGGDGDDVLTAKTTDSVFDGGAGNDKITVGGSGNVVTGGSGRDEFVMMRPNLGYWGELVPAIEITDFSAGEGGDVLNVDQLLQEMTASFGYSGEQPFLSDWMRLTADGDDTLLVIRDPRSGHDNWVTAFILRGVQPEQIVASNFSNNMDPLGVGTPLVYQGSDANETLVGTEANDSIAGGAGNDSIGGGWGGNDSLYGEAGNDSMHGGDGDDILDGGADVDGIDGGLGNDLIAGGEGDDQGAVFDSAGYYLGQGLIGSYGDDTINGDDGDDIIDGGYGNNVLNGGAGDDAIYTGYGTHQVRGGTGNDTLRTSQGPWYMTYADGSALYGEDGNDLIEAWGNGLSVDGGAGNDEILSSGANSTITGGLDNDRIVVNGYGMSIDGGDGDDDITGEAGFSGTIAGGSGNDSIDMRAYYGGSARVEGGEGDDILRFSISGPTTVNGGAGRDQFAPGISSTVVIEDFAVGPDGDKLDLDLLLTSLASYGFDGSQHPFLSGWLRLVEQDGSTLLQFSYRPDGYYGYQTVAILQNVTPAQLTSANFTRGLDPLGNFDPLSLTGSAGADQLSGAGGDDSISGGEGNDLLDGAYGGNDSLNGDSGSDTLLGYDGDDSLDGGADADMLLGGRGNDYLAGADGDDKSLTHQAGGVYVVGGLIGGDGNDTLDGGRGDDDLDGGAGDDLLFGGDGADWLNGRAGNDWLDGGDGDDRISSYEGVDTVIGGAGNDTIDGYGFEPGASIDGGVGHDSLFISSGSAISVSGGDGNDELSHYGGRPYLNNSVIDMGAGDDSVSVGGSGNTVIGGDGHDVLSIGGTGHVIEAGSGDDIVNLSGLEAGAQRLQITLGDGRDRVVLAYAGTSASVPVITDFVTGAGGDVLDLDVLGARLNWSYDWSWNGPDPFANGNLRLSLQDGNTIIEARVYDSLLGTVYVPVATLQGVENPGSLTADNFLQTVQPVYGGNQIAVTPALQTRVAQEDQPLLLSLEQPVDPDGGSFTYAISELPLGGYLQLANGDLVRAGTTLSAEQFSALQFVPYSDVADLTGRLVYAIVDDEGSASYGQVHIAIEPVNDAPRVLMTEAVYLDNGLVPFELDMSSVVSDPDHSQSELQIELDLNTLPSWLSYDAEQQRLVGVAPEGTSDSYSISYTVTDPLGESVTGQLQLRTGGVTLEGGNYYDNLYGGSGNDNLIGNGGGDQLYGGGGDDSLYGGTDSDSLYGGSGNDLLDDTDPYYYGYYDRGYLDGGTGADTMIGGWNGNTFIVDNAGDTVIETNEYNAFYNDEIHASIDYVLAEGTYVEVIRLTGADDRSATGNSRNNWLYGNGADNVLNGGGGLDYLNGGAGNDTYIVDSSDDQVDETWDGSGNDTVISSVSYKLNDYAGIENLILTGNGDFTGTGSGGNNFITGNSASNLLQGMYGNDTLDGGAGFDALYGGFGDDLFIVDSAFDQVYEDAGAGNDTVRSSVSFKLGSNIENGELSGTATARLTGNGLDNRLTGHSGDSALLGGAGNDTLTGGAGRDSLVGGAGSDAYLFQAGSGLEIIDEQGQQEGDVDTLKFAEGISRTDLSVGRLGDHLRISLNGTQDAVVIKDWFNGSANQVELFEFANGEIYSNAQVNALIGAMATMAPASATSATATLVSPPDAGSLLAVGVQ